MRRDYHRWFSPALERDMELLVFGHAGARVLVFPTSMGRFYQWEDFGMVNAVRDLLESGSIQLICVDGVDTESWYAEHKHPGDRAWRHEQYDRYVLDEVLPFTQWINPDPFLITTGTSFGAYHAVNFALKHPHRVGRTIGMSGLYDIRRYVGDHYDINVYHNNPVDFIPNETDFDRLEHLRKLDIILAVGRDDSLLGSNEELARKLWEKGIGNALRVWDGWQHDWSYWYTMFRHFLPGHD